MEVRDPIYGLIKYNETEEKVLNSKPVQRLRNIKQLAYCNYVYPGATHTRFDHSLGVMHVAGLMGENLKLNGDEVAFIRLAGLLHDVGHGPFSHVSEQILESFANEEALKGYNVEQFHEALTIRIIAEKLNGVIPAEYKERFINLFQKSPHRSIEKDIISGPLDADKIDYLFRDSYFSGVKYGIFDQHKVLESLRRIPAGGKQEQIGISEEGVFAVEQLLLGRYHMRTQVYTHRIRRIADAMLVRGIELALQEELPEIQQVFLVNTDSLDFFLEFDDYKLIRSIVKNGRGYSKKIISFLQERVLFKEFFNCELSRLEFPDVFDLTNILQLDRKRLNIIEHKIAKEVLKIASEFVIVDKNSVNNPTFYNPLTRRIDPNSIMVLMENGGARVTFPQASMVFNGGREPMREYLYVYAFLPDISREERLKLAQKMRDVIKGIILEEARRS